ncbi:MAG: NAD(P)H-hydrate epimerase [Phycisphaerales bacterium]|nr:NAD(P)H-hydrate epimerase [Phycisphaerales bacterium]
MRLPDHRIRVLDRAAARALDAAATGTYGIPGIVLMENAAVGASEIAMGMIPSGGSVAIACGPGANGGDGWAMARHLHNAGYGVDIITLTPAVGSPAAAVNASIAAAMQIPMSPSLEPLERADLIIDAVFGTGLDRELTGPLLAAVEAINAARGGVLAVDIPSGLDADTGMPRGLVVRADQTATFACWKAGFLEMESLRWTGDIHCIDIGAPQELADQMGRPLEPTSRHGRGR